MTQKFGNSSRPSGARWGVSCGQWTLRGSEGFVPGDRRLTQRSCTGILATTLLLCFCDLEIFSGQAALGPTSRASAWPIVTSAGSSGVRAAEIVRSHPIRMVTPCFRYVVIRLWLLDRLGSLGRVVTERGELGSDLVGVDIPARDRVRSTGRSADRVARLRVVKSLYRRVPCPDIETIRTS
jgi:hypothetical protein